MNFRILIILLVVLFLFPIVSHSIPTENLMFEGQLLEYYKFKQTHNLLSRDATNSRLTRGHELKYERLLEEVTNDLLVEPSTKIPELITFITTGRENGNYTGKYFIGLLDSLKSRLLDEDFSNMQYFRELETVILEPVKTNSGYLLYLSEKTGDNEPLQDEQYTKWFSNKPWNQGLLKFYGDTLYFTRRFDKAIEIYTRILKDTSLSGLKGGTLGKYDSFYESEVRNKLGSCYLIQKNYKESANQFYKASTLTDVPEAAVNQLFEAHSLIRDKKYDKALVILEKAKSHKFLPEELINSMLIQEAVVLRAKGEPRKIIKLLSKFENSKNSEFLLKPDNKFVYKLLDGAYRQIGNIEKADEMREKTNNIPRLTKSEKLDPIVEAYEKYINKVDRLREFFVDIDVDANYDGKINDLDEPLEETQGGVVVKHKGWIEIKLSADPSLISYPGGIFILYMKGFSQNSFALKLDKNIKNKDEDYMDIELPYNGKPLTIKVYGLKESKKTRDISFTLGYYNEDYALNHEPPLDPDEPIFSDSVKLTIYDLDINCSSKWVDPENDEVNSLISVVTKPNTLEKVELVIYDKLYRMVFNKLLTRKNGKISYLWDGKSNIPNLEVTGEGNPYTMIASEIMWNNSKKKEPPLVIEHKFFEKIYAVHYAKIGNTISIPEEAVPNSKFYWLRFRKPTIYNGEFLLEVDNKPVKCNFYNDGMSENNIINKGENPCKFPGQVSTIPCYAKLEIKEKSDVKVSFSQTSVATKMPRPVWFWPVKKPDGSPSLPLLLHSEKGSLEKYDEYFKGDENPTNAKQKEIDLIKDNPLMTGHCDGATYVSINYPNELEIKEKFQNIINLDKGEDIIEGILISLCSRQKYHSEKDIFKLNIDPPIYFPPNHIDMNELALSKIAYKMQFCLEKNFCIDDEILDNKNILAMLGDFGPLREGGSKITPNNVSIFGYRCDYRELSFIGEYFVKTTLYFYDHHSYPSNKDKKRSVEYSYSLKYDEDGNLSEYDKFNRLNIIKFDNGFFGCIPHILMTVESFELYPNKSSVTIKKVEKLFEKVSFSIYSRFQENKEF